MSFGGKYNYECDEWVPKSLKRYYTVLNGQPLLIRS